MAPQLELADGRLYFATSRGVIQLSDNLVKDYSNETKKFRQRTFIEKIIVNGVEFIVDPLSNVTSFESDKKNITFSFASLDFSPYIQESFKYYLEGFDSKWNSVSDINTIQYTNLKPGKYIFWVRSSEILSNENDVGDSFIFEIQKPIYLRWYFIILYILVLIILGFVVFKIVELKHIAKSMAKSNMVLEQLSYTDVLTGVDNRRSLYRLCEDIWHNSIVKKQEIVIIMVDIDFFKNYNDMYGHLSGDVVLKEVAQTLRSCIQETKGVLLSEGGEEFVVVLVDMSVNTAVKIAKNMNRSVYELEIPSALDHGKNLSISIGIYGNVPTKDTSWQLFIDKADKALYFEKSSGRNTIRIYEGK